MEVGLWGVLLVGAYLLGSVVPGLWIARAMGVDIRQVGSGNIGSTNVYRILGFWPGFFVQLIDIGKAALAVLIAQKAGAGLELGYGVATSAVLGHMYPVWAGFRGGKGINTLLGAMLILEPASAVAALGTFLLSLAIVPIVSVGSMAAVASFLLWHGLVGDAQGVGYVFGLGWLGLVLYSHRANLQRLLAGTEPRIGQRKS